MSLTVESLCEEGQELVRDEATSSDPVFKAWKSRVMRHLIKTYGENSFEARDFDSISFSLHIYTGIESHHDFVQACASGIQETILKLRSYAHDDEADAPASEAPLDDEDKRRIFIVHGHDEAMKQKLARAIERQGLEAVILAEQENGGRTLIEKFQDCSDVAAAVCLFTADDQVADASGDPSFRARQNVVLETGYFIGRIGRERVVVVRDKNVELPSDLQGFVYTDADHAVFDVLKELRQMGLPIDLNQI